MRIAAVLCVSLLAAALPYPTWSQVSTAALNGTARDATGSIVSDAKVVLHNTATGVDRITQSNSAGVYVFLNVPPGAYTLEMSKDGFSTEKIAPFKR
jgi:hypothetical protein